MTGTQHRLRAVFLCAFASALIVLLVAFAAWASVFAQINRAKAQDYPGVCPVWIGSFQNVVISNGGDYEWLTGLQMRLYFEAALGRSYPGTWVPGIVAYWPDGTALIGGIAADHTICLAGGVVPAAVHERGMRAAKGQPA